MRIFAAALVLILAACARPTTLAPQVDAVKLKDEENFQRRHAFAEMEANNIRFNEVRLRLVAAAVPMCQSKVTGTHGMYVHSFDGFSLEWRDAGQHHYAIGRYPKIVHVFPDSTAEAAGVRAGDEMVEINDIPLGSEAGTSEAMHKAAMQASLELKPLNLTLLRGGSLRKVMVPPKKICGNPGSIRSDDTINAFADGTKIILTSGMMRFAQTDEELALVVAHEIAHNLRHHIDAMRANEVAGGVTGALIDILLAGGGGINTQGTFADAGARKGRLAYSQDFEAEADYVGLYLMARAGYRIDDAAKFWRRVAVKSSGSTISHGTTHPPTAFRFAALDATVSEIKAKQARGEDLLPNESKR